MKCNMRTEGRLAQYILLNQRGFVALENNVEKQRTINRSAVEAAESITALLCHLAVTRETLVHYIIGHPSLLMSFVTIISLGPLTPTPTKTRLGRKSLPWKVFMYI